MCLGLFVFVWLCSLAGLCVSLRALVLQSPRQTCLENKMCLGVAAAGAESQNWARARADPVGVRCALCVRVRPLAAQHKSFCSTSVGVTAKSFALCLFAFCVCVGFLVCTFAVRGHLFAVTSADVLRQEAFFGSRWPGWPAFCVVCACAGVQHKAVLQHICRNDCKTLCLVYVSLLFACVLGFLDCSFAVGGHFLQLPPQMCLDKKCVGFSGAAPETPKECLRARGNFCSTSVGVIAKSFALCMSDCLLFACVRVCVCVLACLFALHARAFLLQLPPQMCFDVKRFFVFAGAGVGTKTGASSGAWTQSACVCVVCVCRAPKNKFAAYLWMRLQILLLFVCVVCVCSLARLPSYL